MEFILLQTLFLVLPFLFVYFYFISHTQPNKTKPGFKIYPLLGTLPDILKNRHRYLDWSTDVLMNCPTNTSTLWRPGRGYGITTANPSNVEHMLKTNFENYPKGEKFIELLQDFLGRGILNSDGEAWKLQRKTASYEFSTKSLRNFVMENVVVEIQNRLIPVLIKASSCNESDKNGVLNLQDVLERFAFDNICKVAFNVDPNCLGGETNIGDEFMRAFDDAATLSSGRFMYAFPLVYKLKKFLNIGSEKVLKQSIAKVHEFADGIIRNRMKYDTNSSDEDLLSRFISNHKSSPEFLRDIIINFVLAGRDTTSSGLCWFFWLISSRQEVKQKIREELEEIRRRRQRGKLPQDDKGEFYDFNELHEMHYLQAVISETMRLYPPVPADTKACLNDDVMPDGTFVGKGWFVTYNNYAMGRMENIWGKNCRDFLPERWIDDNGVCRIESTFKFPVFQAGLRMCLGKDMAYVQMKSIAAAVIERFDLEVLEKDACPEFSLSLTLRMKGGLHVRVKARN